MRKTRLALLLGCALALAVGAGAQDFSRYVAIGDSLTAGYASGGLVRTYQVNSYPALLAEQFGTGSFEQPLVSEPGIPPVLELQALNVVNGQIVPTIAPSAATYGQPTNATLQGPYNNYGIPGANVNQLITRTGDITRLLQQPPPADISSTIMYDLILRQSPIPGTQFPGTALNWAVAAQGTFYTVWAGNNDVLGAALAGVAADGITLTSVASFTQAYQTLLGTLHAARPNAGIVVATIPDVTAIPFVTTVKPYLMVNGNKVPLIGANGPLTEQDYVTLPASALIQQGYGVPGTGRTLPEGGLSQAGLQTGVILRADEVALIKQRTAELNDVIRATANGVGAKVVDMNAFFADIAANGVIVGGARLTPAFLTGGLFSYDGVHPQSLGYAIIANEFIRVINEEFDADVPLVDLRPFVFGADAASVESRSDEFTFTEEAWRSMLQTLVQPVSQSRVPRVVRPRLERPGHGKGDQQFLP